MGVKHLLRRAAATTIGGLGLDRAAARLAGGRAVILAYHRVLDPARHDLDAVEPGLYVTRDAFARHLDLLRRRYHVVPLPRLAQSHVTGEPLPWGTVVITFDDAWLDTYEVAFGLLREAGLPATVFVPTALIDADHRFWFSRAAAATRNLWDRRDSLAAAFPEDKMPADARFIMDTLVANPPRAAYFTRVLEGLKTLDADRRETVLDFLIGLTDKPVEAPPELAGWDQLREMHAAGIELGSHTAHHELLTQLTTLDVREELDQSKRTLAAEIGVSPVSFCYPNGSYDEKIARQVQRAGYACAVTTEPGFADAPGELFALPRLGVHQGVAPDANGLALLLSGIG